MVILNVKNKCLIISDSTNLGNNKGYCSYQFDPTGNRLTVAKKVADNALLLNYREVHYMYNGLPDKSVTYLNGNEFYETQFYYKDGSVQPFKCEQFFTNKLNQMDKKNTCGFGFFYDSKDRLVKVTYSTAQVGDVEYALTISYNEHDNVLRMEYEYTSGQFLPNSVIMVSGFDGHPNPYYTIPYWKFLMMNGNWDNPDPEPIITGLSRNNPLGYATGKFERVMSYAYNNKGLPLSRINTNKSDTSVHSFNESFNYRCP